MELWLNNSYFEADRHTTSQVVEANSKIVVAPLDKNI